MKDKFLIKGMSCSSCASAIERELKKLNGIKKVDVNLLNNFMYVEYDKDIVSCVDIENKVKSIGYFAYIEEKEKKDEKKDFKIDENVEIKDMKKRVLFSFVFLFFLMYVSMGNMLGLYTFEFLKGYKMAVNFSFTQFLLTLPIMYINRNYYIKGFKALIKKNPNMDSLVALGSVSSVVFGIYVIYKLSFALGNGDFDILHRYYHSIYFESGAMILTLITFGKYLESLSKEKTNNSVKKLIDLSPKVAIVFKDGKEIKINAQDIQKGDIVIIKEGLSCAVDGEVVEGCGFFDTSSITGESEPVLKNVGDSVLTSSILKDGYVKVLAKKVKDETILSKIIELVEMANATKPKLAKLVDKVSYFFVPTVILISILTFLTWMFLGYRVDFSLEMAISVLVISCPCALGLATPVAIMVSTGKAARLGILVKSSESLEKLSKTSLIVFDKTGTLTKGKPFITNIISNSLKEEDIVKILCSLEKYSNHPIALSIVQYAKEKNIEPLEVLNFKNNLGLGISGDIDGKKYFLGNLKYILKQEKLDGKFLKYFKEFSNDGKTVVILKDEKEILALVALSDKIKESSKVMIDILKNMNIKTLMLTGDNEKVASNICKKLGIDSFYASLLPYDKEKIIKDLMKREKNVVMVGDGINDSPSLSLASVGISIKNATDIAIEASDIILMKDDMLDIINIINLSKKTIRNIKENLFWAFIYNIICIPIAFGILYIPFKIRLNAMIASFSMSLSSLFVILNALRLSRFKKIDILEKEKKEIKKDTEFKIINVENKIKKGDKKMKKKVIIDGMSCDHCKNRVEKEFNKINGVKAFVNLEEKSLTLEMEEEILDEKIKEIVENLDYTFVKILN